VSINFITRVGSPVKTTEHLAAIFVSEVEENKSVMSDSEEEPAKGLSQSLTAHVSQPIMFFLDLDFNDLLQKAAHIKGEAMKSNRRKFDSWPKFFQNTMFHGNEVLLTFLLV
jgi:hypothetical protein